jgi:NADPH:quinone reductase-like Zn-dependent oxidoreductase
MKAIIYTQYGGPERLHLQETAQPTPKENEVLVKVRAASLNVADLHMLTADPIVMRLITGLLKPKNTILGSDMAGEVMATGSNVRQFKVGDAVFGDLSDSGWGALAEAVCAREEALVLKPANLSFEQAAAAPMSGLTALQGLVNFGQLQAGQKVLVNGASGGVGSFAVQIAKALGAEVTAVCSGRNVDQARGLGADQVIDYTQEDFTRCGQRYDLIFAANGNLPLAAYERMLLPKGFGVIAGGGGVQMSQAILLGPIFSVVSGKKMGSLLSRPNQKDLLLLSTLMETGKVTPVIERRCALSETPEAFRYLAQGHARGKLVITLS